MRRLKILDLAFNALHSAKLVIRISVSAVCGVNLTVAAVLSQKPINLNLLS
mgnify:CR=1 FL=1